MKLHADAYSGLNTVTAYGAGYIEVNRQRHETTVAFAPQGAVTTWAIRELAELTGTMLSEAAGIANAAATDPLALLEEDDAPPPVPRKGGVEVVLLGTGPRQQFPKPDVLRPLARAGIGVEVMDTLAAARTYNILMAEGRHVVAVLLPA